LCLIVVTVTIYPQIHLRSLGQKSFSVKYSLLPLWQYSDAVFTKVVDTCRSICCRVMATAVAWDKNAEGSFEGGGMRSAVVTAHIT
jgi:hypothetical protein